MRKRDDLFSKIAGKIDAILSQRKKYSQKKRTTYTYRKEKDSSISSFCKKSWKWLLPVIIVFIYLIVGLVYLLNGGHL